MWPFRKLDRKPDVLDKLLDIEARKAELRGNIELRKLELEAEHIEERTKADIELRDWKAKRRDAMRKLNATAKRDPITKRLLPTRGAADAGCALCDDPLRRDVTIAMVLKHREHDGAGGLPMLEPPAETDSQTAPKAPTDLN